MTYGDEFFRPEEVDQQIARLSQQDIPGGISSGYPPAEAEFIAYLQSTYSTDAQQQQSLDRAWKRITQVTPSLQQQQAKPERLRQIMYTQATQARPAQHKRGKALQERFGILVAIILLTVLVGSMAAVFYAIRHNSGHPTSTGAHHPVTQPVTHARGPLGKIVYSTSINGSDGPVFSLAWSPDSQRLGVGTLEAQSWDATTGKHVVHYGPQSFGSILSEAWSPDGKRFAVAGSGLGVNIYDAATGKLLLTYPGSPQASTPLASEALISFTLPNSGGTGTYATAWSPDGSLMATAFFGTSNSVQVWNTKNGKLVVRYLGNADTVGSLAWSPDGKDIASQSFDGSTQVWNALTGQRIQDFENNVRGSCSVAWSPDGKSIAYLDNDAVKVANPATGKILLTHNGAHDRFGLSTLSWSPGGKSIASAGDHIELWDVATGKTYYTFTKNSMPIRVLTWSPDGRYIASADSPNNPNTPSTIQVWTAD